MTPVRESAIIPLVPTADHTGKDGYAVKNSSGSAALVSAVTDIPIGVIVDGQPTSGHDSVIPVTASGGRVVKVKLAASPGTVNPWTHLAIHSDGSFKADPATGNRVLCAQALQAGTAGELIDAILYKPESLS